MRASDLYSTPNGLMSLCAAFPRLSQSQHRNPMPASGIR